MADAVSKWNKNATYVYCWSWAPKVQDVIDYNGLDNAEVSPYGRAMHCMELAFVLNNPDGYPELNGDQANFLKIFWILQGKLGMLSLKQGILAMI